MKVEIWSDVVCPWCYVGKRRFETALRQFEHKDEVTVEWKSFQLDPSVPRGSDEPVMGWLTKKLRTTEAQVRAMNKNLEGLARAEGLDYHLDTARTAHTIDAHRMLHLAKAKGLADAAEERFFRAQFTENLALGDHETLVRLMRDIGVNEAEVRGALASDAFAADVEADLEAARELGIGGVPCFVIDRTFGVSGAQDPEVLLGALREAWRRRA